MRRSAVCAAVVAVAAASVATGWSVNAQAGLLDGGEVELPGGGGVELPGGGNDGIGVDLPGELDGDGIQIGGGGDSGGGSGGGGSSTPLPDLSEPSAPAPAPAPAPEPTQPAPEPTTEETGSGSGTSVGGGSGGGDGIRGDERERDRKPESGGTTADRDPFEPPPVRRPDGAPTSSNPGLTVAGFGPAPVGVPNFVIDSFSIPPFLLPIYQSCGTQYGIPWQVLASINRIETAFGTNLNVSSAGALGWMQFMPATWQAYGVDANNDGRKDPYNPVDAICAAARYLDASGYSEDVRGAIFAYNHADWYVDEVLLYANQYGKLPGDLVGSLTGLTEGARFPVAANARYADDIAERRALKRSQPGKAELAGNAADVISSSPTRRGIDVFTREEAPVVAVNDGVVTEMGKSNKLGRYLVLRDNYGNRFTYAELGELQEAYPVPRERKGAGRAEAESAHDEAPDAKRTRSAPPGDEPGAGAKQRLDAQSDPASQAVNTEDSRDRLFAFPDRQEPSALSQPIDPTERFLERVGYETFRSYFGVRKFDPQKTELRPLREGSRVVAGTVLGRVGDGGKSAPHLHFAIQPAGRGAPTIDPKPILDGWKLLEATHIYRAAGKDPFAKDSASSGQVLLLSKEQAIRQLLAEPRVEIYDCGRQDVQTGQIDVRVMKMLLYLAKSGFRMGVTSLKCGHSVYTSSGNISHHSIGGAVDIATINGLPVLGNQGPGSVTEGLIRHILELQGTMVPDQIISLMNMGGPTFVMGDHADHVHVGYSGAASGPAGAEPQLTTLLKPQQWERLIDRLGEIENPEVPSKPSRYSLKVKRQRGGNGRGGAASPAHIGE